MTLWCRKPRKRVDHRTRRDRSIRLEEAFDRQNDAMTTAYMSWSREKASRRDRGYFNGEEVPADAGSLKVKVVDVFSKYLNAHKPN